MSTAVFFNIPAHGHVNPSLPLVSELARRGERVIYYNTEAFRGKVEGAGAEFRAYTAPDEERVGQGADSPLDVMARLMTAAEAVIPAVLDEVRTARPDYVIYDSMCVWGKQIARILGLPAICSCSIFFVGSQNFQALPREGAIGRRMLGHPLEAGRYLWTHFSAARRLKRRYGVDSPGVFDFFGNPGDMTLVYTSRYFQIGGERLDETFKFVGPSLVERNDHAGFPFEFLEGGPVVYISLGTIFNDRPRFFRLCMDAFGNSRLRAVMSVGGRVDTAALGPIPQNFLVLPHAPQLEILRRASLFVTHGGMNSASESAWFGVPMVVAPQMGDQLVIARRVEQLGAGVVVDSHHFTAQGLREAAEQVLCAESFRRQSRAIGESFRQAGGYVRAADEVFEFKKRVGRG